MTGPGALQFWCFIAMVALYAVGALGALAAGSPRASRFAAGIGAFGGSLAGLLLAVTVLAGRGAFELTVPELLPVAGGLALRLDRLGAFFLLVIDIVAVPAALFGVVYSDVYDHRYSLRLLGAMFNGFLLSMSLVTAADNVLTFLVLWEAMSLTSYLMVITEHDDSETLRAGAWYLAMTHGGFVALVVMFMLLGNGSALAFSDLRAGAGRLPATTRDVVFVLALLGFGLKAGIVPLHVWLPRAHPAAPSHVSALMSGAMIKLGIYGLLRVVVDLTGAGPAWWGGLVLALGAASALLGVLYALMEHDLKRLLAFHSVENIGIILLALGAGMMFQAYHLPALAALGLVAALFHTVNHACFKGLLFLGAGATMHATGTRNMEEMGGLIKRMPQTAVFFLVGSVAISALPPLNGFASEWMVFQALLGGARIPRPEVALLMTIAVGMLALTSGLAAACFVKAFGITFLAIPRSARAANAREVPKSMRAGMAWLAAACVALGLGAVVVVPMLGRVLGDVAGLEHARSAQFTLGLSLAAPAGFGQVSIPVLALGLTVIVAIVLGVLRLLRATERPRVADTWGCGRVGQSPRMEYTATSFAEPLRRVFAELYRPAHDLSREVDPTSRYFIRSMEYHSRIVPWFEQAIYEPILALVRLVATQVRRLQGGSLHLYLAYLTLALVGLLIATWWIQ